MKLSMCVCCIILIPLIGSSYAQSEYYPIDLTKYSTNTIDWPYEKISPGSYVTSTEEIPIHITKVLKFDYDSSMQEFPVNVKASEVYVFLNSMDARNDERGGIVGWIILNFADGDKLKYDVIVGKNIRNFETNSIAIEDYGGDWVQHTDSGNTVLVYSEEVNFFCKEYNYEHDVCTDYYAPNFEYIDMMKIPVPITHVNRNLESIILEGNVDGYTNAFVSAITVKSFDGTITPNNLTYQGDWLITIIIIVGIITIIVIAMLVRARRPSRTEERRHHPRGSFSKDDGTFTP